MEASTKYKDYRIVFEKPMKKTHPEENSFDVSFRSKDLLTFIENHVENKYPYIQRIMPNGEGVKYNELENLLADIKSAQSELKSIKIPVMSYFKEGKLINLGEQIVGAFNGSPLKEKDGAVYGVNINGLYKRTLKDIGQDVLFGEKKLEINYDYRKEVSKDDPDSEGFSLGLGYGSDSVRFEKVSASNVWKDQIKYLKNFVFEAERKKKDLVVISRAEYQEKYSALYR